MISLKIAGAAALLAVSSIALTSAQTAAAEKTGGYAKHRSSSGTSRSINIAARGNCGPGLEGGGYYASGVVPGAWGTPYDHNIYPDDYGSAAYYARVCRSGSSVR
jgi:hypothetical protein